MDYKTRKAVNKKTGLQQHKQSDHNLKPSEDNGSKGFLQNGYMERNSDTLR